MKSIERKPKYQKKLIFQQRVLELYAQGGTRRHKEEVKEDKRIDLMGGKALIDEIII